MLFQEDTTYFDIKEKAVRQWLEEMHVHDDLAVRGGVKATTEYIDALKQKITFLEEKCALKDNYLKKMAGKKR